MAESLLLILLALLLLSLLGAGLPSFRGTWGEAKVSWRLKGELDPESYEVHENIMLPAGDGTTQIDQLIISRFGIFVIETKNLKGWIFGNAMEAYWTQVLYKSKYRFRNPQRQNYGHVRVVQDLLGLRGWQIHSVVVFAGDSEPKTAMPENVVWGTRSLVAFVRSKRREVLAPEELAAISERLHDVRIEPNLKASFAHVQHVRRKVAEREADATRCPRCDSKLVVRTNRRTGERFMGCSRYPACRGTRKLA